MTRKLFIFFFIFYYTEIILFHFYSILSSKIKIDILTDKKSRNKIESKIYYGTINCSSLYKNSGKRVDKKEIFFKKLFFKKLTNC
jgi:hypothetical protein